MPYVVMVDGKEILYRYFRNAWKKYKQTNNNHFKSLYEIWFDKNNLYQSKLLWKNK